MAMIESVSSLLTSIYSSSSNFLFTIYQSFIMSYNYSEYPRFIYSDKAHQVIKDIVSEDFFSKRLYEPPWWARNGHMQTILSAIPFLNRPSDVVFNRELITLPDGGELALDWGKFINFENNFFSDILIILPGLTGAAKDYRNIVREGLVRNYQVVVFNKRGHGDTELKTAKMQTFGEPNDFRFVLEKLSSQLKSNQRIFAIGFSAGSGLLVSYLGYHFKTPLIDCAVAISPGYDAEHLLKILPSFYKFLMLIKVKCMIWKHRKILKEKINLKKIVSTNCFREFEHEVYGLPNGYQTPKDYWEDNNPINALNVNQTPIMCISALDDPVCVGEVVKPEYFHENSNSVLCLTQRGGHCAFFHGPDLKKWADEVAVDFIDRFKYKTI